MKFSTSIPLTIGRRSGNSGSAGKRREEGKEGDSQREKRRAAEEEAVQVGGKCEQVLDYGRELSYLCSAPGMG